MKLRKILSILLITGVIVLSGLAFAYKNTDFTNPSISSHSVLFEEPTVSDSDGHYVTTEFATPSGDSSNINVYFKGSPSDAVVTLQKKGLFGNWSDVGSFTPNSSDNYSKEMTGKASTTYRTKIDSNSGAKILGHLRVK